jgi:hypothetical protein
MSCKTWMIRVSPRTPDRLPELSGLHVQLLEVCKTMVGTYGPYNSGGSATTATWGKTVGQNRVKRGGRPWPVASFAGKHRKRGLQAIAKQSEGTGRNQGRRRAHPRAFCDQIRDEDSVRI